MHYFTLLKIPEIETLGQIRTFFKIDQVLANPPPPPGLGSVNRNMLDCKGIISFKLPWHHFFYDQLVVSVQPILLRFTQPRIVYQFRLKWNQGHRFELYERSIF